MPLKNSLNRAFAEAEDLAPSFGNEFFWIQRESHDAGMLRYDQRNRERPFSAKSILRGEVGQFRSQCIVRGFHAACSSRFFDAIWRGSRMLAARKRTTGAATPSPERW